MQIQEYKQATPLERERYRERETKLYRDTITNFNYKPIWNSLLKKKVKHLESSDIIGSTIVETSSVRSYRKKYFQHFHL